ncbi:hypothetical protein L1887_58498 [Cichorium endivia]|nr:hypothetical protein L1887_58498 [Cichorium endivia]
MSLAPASSSSALHIDFPASAGSGVMHSRSVTGVQVHPVALFSILDHYLRRNDGQHRVIGTLLGTRTETSTRARPRRTRRSTSPWTPPSTPPKPTALGIRSYISSPLGAAPKPENCVFLPLPTTLLHSTPEHSSLSLLASHNVASPLTDLDALAVSLNQVQAQLERVLTYVRAVIAGEKEGDKAVGPLPQRHHQRRARRHGRQQARDALQRPPPRRPHGLLPRQRRPCPGRGVVPPHPAHLDAASCPCRVHPLSTNCTTPPKMSRQKPDLALLVAWACDRTISQLGSADGMVSRAFSRPPPHVQLEIRVTTHEAAVHARAAQRPSHALCLPWLPRSASPQT